MEADLVDNLSEEQLVARIKELKDQLQAIRLAGRSTASEPSLAQLGASPTETSVPADTPHSTSDGRVLMTVLQLPFHITRGKDARISPQPDADQLSRLLLSMHASTPSMILVGGAIQRASDGPILPLEDAELKSQRLLPIMVEPSRFLLAVNGYCYSILQPILHSIVPSDGYALEAHEGMPLPAGLTGPIQRIVTETSMFDAFVALNRQFAESIKMVYQPNDIVIINDYQLFMLPQLLREQLPHCRIAFYLDTPFPSSELFRLLPERTTLLQHVLGADILAFQTQDYLRHFISTSVRLLGAEASPRYIEYGGRRASFAVHPCGVDVSALQRVCASPSTSERVRRLRELYVGVHVILGVDIADARSGVTSKLHIFERLLKMARGERLKKPVILVEVLTPRQPALIADTSRSVLAAVHELTGKINGLYGQSPGAGPGPMGGPVFQIPGPIDIEELVPLYCMADSLLVTSHSDGMNLTAGEYVACRQAAGKAATVVVSEFAGCAQTLDGAFMINPHHVMDAASTLMTAITLEPEHRRERHSRLWASVRNEPFMTWCHNLAQELRTTRFQPGSLSAQPSEVYPSHVVSSLTNLSGAVLCIGVDAFCDPGKQIAELPAAQREHLARLLSHVAALPTVSLVLVSTSSPDDMDAVFGSIPCTLIAEDGCFVKWMAGCEWESPISETGAQWQHLVIPVMEYFNERTTGARIMKKRRSITWNYQLSPAPFGALQAKDLTSTLAEFTARLPVVVSTSRRGCVDVRPAGTNKAMCLFRVMQVLNRGRELCNADKASVRLMSVDLDPSFAHTSTKVDSPDALRSVVESVYAKLYKIGDSGVRSIILIASGDDAADTALAHMLRSQIQRASRDTSLRVLRQGDSSQSSVGLSRSSSLNFATAVPPAKPLNAYGARRLANSVTFMSLDDLGIASPRDSDSSQTRTSRGASILPHRRTVYPRASSWGSTVDVSEEDSYDMPGRGPPMRQADALFSRPSHDDGSSPRYRSRGVTAETFGLLESLKQASTAEPLPLSGTAGGAPTALHRQQQPHPAASDRTEAHPRSESSLLDENSTSTSCTNLSSVVSPPHDQTGRPRASSSSHHLPALSFIDGGRIEPAPGATEGRALDVYQPVEFIEIALGKTKLRGNPTSEPSVATSDDILALLATLQSDTDSTSAPGRSSRVLLAS